MSVDMTPRCEHGSSNTHDHFVRYSQPRENGCLGAWRTCIGPFLYPETTACTHSGAYECRDNGCLATPIEKRYANEPLIIVFLEACMLSGHIRANPKRYTEALEYALRKHGMIKKGHRLRIVPE